MTTPLKSLAPSPVPPENEDTPAFDPDGRSLALFVIAAAAAMAILYWAQAVFIPIILSILISYALEPLVRSLTRIRLPRVVASALAVAALAGTIGYAAYSLSDDASNIVAAVPEAATKLRQALRREQRNGDSAIQQMQRAADELQRTADEAAGPGTAPRGVQRVQIEEPAIDIRQYVMWGSAGVVTFAGEAVLIVFFVFFLLASGDLFKRKLVRIAGPSLARRKVTVQILDEINNQIERFLMVLVIASVVVGVASWIAFRTVGLEQALFWGLAAGVFNSIPYFGPIIVSLGTAIVAFLQFGTLSMAATVAAVALAITSLEGWLLMPVLARRVVRTNEIAVFISLIFWSFVWGVWGTLLAVPMLVAVKAFCDHVDDLKPIGELLGE
jgi:predicted PurR-regulated permease PerM